jgi:hypothetical protein
MFNVWNRRKNVSFFFQQYDISKLTINAVRQIGYPTLQGFILELQLKRQVSDLVYDSYVVLKTSVSSKSDNLYYEYRAGQYLNSLLHRFPCFVKTHGIYKYSGNDNLTLLESTKTHNFETANQIFKRLQPATIEDSIHSNLGLVIQRVHNSKSFADLLESYENSENKPAIKHEIVCILYQLYFVLSAVPTFTHGDLHIDNLILTQASIGKKFQFHYADVAFECSYVAKMIDVARSCFKGSVAFKEELDAIEPKKFNENMDTIGNYLFLIHVINLI